MLSCKSRAIIFFAVFKRELIVAVSYLSESVIRPRKKIDNDPFIGNHRLYVLPGTAASRVLVS